MRKIAGRGSGMRTVAGSILTPGKTVFIGD